MNLTEFDLDKQSTLIKLNLDLKTLYSILTVTDELNIDSKVREILPNNKEKVILRIK